MTTTTPARSPGHGSIWAAAPAELHLFDEIGQWGVTASAFIAELGAARGRDVVVHISSPGGDLLDGVSMHNALRAHDGHTTAYVSALCASAATVVALGCDERVTSRTGQWMVHRPWMTTVGDVDDHRAAVDVLSRAGGLLTEVYAERCGGTVAQWDAMVAAETWFDAEQSVAAGLAHRVGEAVPVTARARNRQQTVRAAHSGRQRAAAAVRRATAHGITATAQRARERDLSAVMCAALRRPTLSESLVAGFRGKTAR